MPDIATLVLLVLAGLTTQGAEQQSPMSKEIVALQRAVFEARRGEDFIAPSLPRDLALRYLYGRGVEQDVAQGCALLWESRDLAHAPRHDQPAIDIAEGLIDQHCKSLSADQLAEAMTVNACAFIGLQQQVLPLQPGSWIEFSRRGYAIERPSWAG